MCGEGTSRLQVCTGNGTKPMSVRIMQQEKLEIEKFKQNGKGTKRTIWTRRSYRTIGVTRFETPIGPWEEVDQSELEDVFASIVFFVERT